MTRIAIPEGVTVRSISATEVLLQTRDYCHEEANKLRLLADQLLLDAKEKAHAMRIKSNKLKNMAEKFNSAIEQEKELEVMNIRDWEFKTVSDTELLSASSVAPTPGLVSRFVIPEGVES